MEILIESFGVNKQTLVCCFKTWRFESSAGDLFNYAPDIFQPGETINESAAIHLHESFCFEIIQFDTGFDLNYIVISCTNLNKEKLL